MKKILFLFLMSITLILVIGCASEDDDSVVSPGASIAVVETFPPDTATDVPLNTSIYVTFNKAVEPTGMTANTSGTNCYGEIQVSDDDFSTCFEFVTSPTPSNVNTTYTVKPSSNLDGFTTYKLKIRYQYGQDSQGNPLTREQTTVFTTENPIVTVSDVSGNTSEDGSQASFDIILSFQPTNKVTLPISSSDPTEGTVAITELTFDFFSWSTVQTVTVTGVDDSNFDGNKDYSIVLGVASSLDTAFNGKDPADVNLTNFENEVLQITSFQFLVENNTALTSDALVHINQTDKTISAYIPLDTVVTALIPMITVNAGSVTPFSEVVQNFTSPINYTVSLSGLTTEGYTISVNEPVPPPDTQQTLCYDESGVIINQGGTPNLCPPANDVMAQDGTYQADPNPRFSIGSGTTAGTVMDNQTGLVWEQDNSATTGTPTYTWADAPNYCTSLNSASLGGYTGWRLPSRTELSWIVKNEGAAPLTNPFFTGTVSDSSGAYWTSTSSAPDPLKAWNVYFGIIGYVHTESKTNSRYVRCCIRLFGQAHSTILVDNGDQTISDRKTGLRWQKCSYGQSGNDCSEGSAIKVTWTAALSYCETQIGTFGNFAGYSDWRLPNRNELESIVDDTKSIGPAIDTVKFPNAEWSYHWTSTSRALDLSSAHMVSPYGGQVSESGKASSLNVRCVR